MTTPRIPEFAEMTVLPACVIAGGKLGRSYPGAPNMVGWAVFRHKRTEYVHADSELFTTEQEALRYLRDRYKCFVGVNYNRSLVEI